MRSPVSRVAAAAIFVLAITCVALLFHGNGATFAFADFAAPILEAKTVKFKMIVEMKGPPARTITSEVMMLGGARTRMVTELPDKSKAMIIRDLSQGKSLTLVAALKTATVLTITKNRKDKTPEYGDPLAGLRIALLAAQDKPGIEREPLGKKEIDGRRVVGFRISSPDGVFSLWGDPKTGLPVRFEMTMGIDGSMKTTFSDFVFNADMDESLFSLEPPAGYTVTVRNVKTDVSPPEEKDLIEMFREYSNLCDGAFPDSLDLQTTSMIVDKKANIQIQIQSLWEQLAPGKGKPNEVQRRKLEELMLKVIEGNLNEDQRIKIAEQIQEFIETQTQKTAEGGEAQAQETAEFGQVRFREIQQRVQRGLNFANQLPPDADAHYVGKGVSFGAADTPIFWYRPKGSKKYRVIDADLSVRDADVPPNVPTP